MTKFTQTAAAILIIAVLSLIVNLRNQMILEEGRNLSLPAVERHLKP